MQETTTTYPPTSQKNDIQRIRDEVRKQKYQTVIMLREEKKMTWQAIGEKMQYTTAHARRLYLHAKEFEKKSRKNPNLQLTEERCAEQMNAPLIIRGGEARRINARVNEELYRTVLFMRDTERLTYKEISERTGFSISRLISIYGKAASLKRKVDERPSEMTQAISDNVDRKENAAHISKPACPPLMQKSDVWLLKAGVNARKYKSVLELRDGQKLSWQKIGEQMHYSENQVRRYYIRAKKLLALSADNPDLQPLRAATADHTESGGAAAASIIKQEDAKLISARAKYELYRAVLDLREEQNFVFKEIAKRMGFSESHVRQLYCKAVRLRQMAAEQSMKNNR